MFMMADHTSEDWKTYPSSGGTINWQIQANSPVTTEGNKQLKS